MHMLNTIIVLFFTSIASFGDDLEKLYKKINFSSSEYKKYISQITNQLHDDANMEYVRKTLLDSITENSLEPNFIRWHSSNLSLFRDDGNGYILGFYYSEKCGGNVPYGNIFDYRDSSWKINDNERINHGELQVKFFSAINLLVMELTDAALDSSDLDHISKFKTLKKLGLSARNLQFSKPFEFPPNLETLIVRNTVLNTNFFNALNNLRKLKELIILDCTIDLGRVLMDDFELIDKKGTKQTIARPFKQISTVIEKATIIRSHPRIFDYIVTEEWKNLYYLRVDIYSTTTGFATFVHPTDDEISFPALERASIGISENFNSRADGIMKLARERYPNIIGNVRFVEVGSND